MRKLASVKTISAISPIEGKDRIELATVDGWSVIVKKGEFKEGDKCVYMEIDSVLPEKSEFEFLRSKNFRIKTMKMAGCISQGICFPLSILPEKKKGTYEQEDDVTDILGVTQYEPTMDREPTEKPSCKTKKHSKFLMRFAWFRKIVYRKNKLGDTEFPSFIHKTDETRIQNIPYILKNKEPWVATEKVDGSSGTYCFVRGKTARKSEYIVCSRNKKLPSDDGSVYWKISEKYKIREVLEKIIANSEHKWIALQGECIAPKIQGNKYRVTEPDFFAFNLITPDGRLPSLKAKEILNRNGIKFVPIIQTEYTLPDTVEEVLDYAHGRSMLGETLREGIVFRTLDGKQSFKAVDPQFLIKYDE